MILDSYGKPLAASKNETKKDKRTNFKFSSKVKSLVDSLIELPVQSSWLDQSEIDKINRDSTVIAAKARRKSATLKKEILIICDDKTIRENLEETFNYDVINSILDIPFQGFGVFELIWKKKDGVYYPEFIERYYRNFLLEDRVLKYAPYGTPQDIPIYKAVHGVYEAKPDKPYGQPLYNPLFWLIEFKNASMEFWVELLERFGTPWVIAKTEGNKDELADEIYNMLGGDGATIDTDDDIELKTAEKSGNFKELIEYIDDQIRELLTGGNLTGNVKGGSHAAANVHNEIREDLARADENIVNKIIRQVVKLFKEGNYLNDDIQAKLKDKDDPNKELVDRDKVIADMGYRPKKEYIEKTYNIEVEDAAPPQEQNMFQNHKMSFSKSLPQDELDYQTQNIDTSNPLTFQKQILEIVENSKSYDEVQEKLLSLSKNINTNDLYDNLVKYMTNSSIQGVAEIEDENPNG
ncbi:MAG: DUF935 family protein [Sphaerochaetaceae bacterium]|nr:DUF935 family protein [Sphaerochaetaceae bacterium]